MNIILLTTLILFLLFHHRYKHRNEATFSELDKWFQYEDINNHETFVLLIVGIIIGLII